MCPLVTTLYSLGVILCSAVHYSLAIVVFEFINVSCLSCSNIYYIYYLVLSISGRYSILLSGQNNVTILFKLFQNDQS